LLRLLDVNDNGIRGDEGFRHRRSMLQAAPHNLFLQKKILASPKSFLYVATQGIASAETHLGGINDTSSHQILILPCSRVVPIPEVLIGKNLNINKFQTC